MSYTQKSELNLLKSINEIINTKINRIEENFANNFNHLSQDLKKLNSNVNEMKDITDLLKTLKENVLLNFKDIANEFVKKYLSIYKQ